MNPQSKTNYATRRSYNPRGIREYRRRIRSKMMTFKEKETKPDMDPNPHRITQTNEIANLTMRLHQGTSCINDYLRKLGIFKRPTME